MVRKLRESTLRVGDADHGQQLHRPCSCIGRPHAQVGTQALSQLGTDGEHGVERRHRFLEHHRELTASNVAHGVLVEVEHLPALEADAALHDAARRVRHESQYRERGHGLATAGLADNRNRLAFLDIEGDAVHRLYGAGVREEVGAEVLYFEEHDAVIRPACEAASPPGAGGRLESTFATVACS